MQLFNVISRLLTNGHFPYTGGIRPHPHDQPQNQSLQPFEETSEIEADGGHFDVKALVDPLCQNSPQSLHPKRPSRSYQQVQPVDVACR